MAYQPSDKVLAKYADLVVNFALGGGKGIKKGDVVMVSAGLSALPLYRAISRQVLLSGGHTIGRLGDDMHGGGKFFYDHANDDQLKAFFPKYAKGLVDTVDHRVAILSDHDVHELDDVDPKKMLLGQKAAKPLIEWFDKKEQLGLYTWTLVLYGTPSMAKESGIKLEEYWKQIIRACYLDKANPVKEWQRIQREVQRVAQKLTAMKIKDLHVQGKDADLRIKVGQKRRWMAGGGRNIPSFEVFTSPDWRGTEGWIRFNQPMFNFGPRIEGVELHFEKGRVVKVTAKSHEKLLHTLVDTDTGAAQVGEFSLTDRRLSRITKFMANTLYDENMGGPYGNTHLALGKSYKETFSGNVAKLSKAESKKLGFNESVIHDDFISTIDRTVTATLPGGTTKVIYRKGQFTI